MDFDPKVTEIKPGPQCQLQISREFADDPAVAYPVFLLVPQTGSADHYHVRLTREQAMALRDWINDYLWDT